MDPYQIIDAKPALPILISVPHCGTRFPDELQNQYKKHLIASPDDTDWFVDKLYDFAPAMGITMIKAVFSRWVIDLNRDPESKPLYSDGRIITGLCPTTNFLGETLYEDCRTEVSDEETARRLRLYYWPYHTKIEELLNDLHAKYKQVLLWDCHSIRQVVSTIQKEKIPDLILGSVDETSASAELIKLAHSTLQRGSYQLNHNDPFKGGFITRHFGKPGKNQHALQLEMTKVNYMDDTETKYDKARADKMREVLKVTLGALAEKLISG